MKTFIAALLLIFPFTGFAAEYNSWPALHRAILKHKNPYAILEKHPEQINQFAPFTSKCFEDGFSYHKLLHELMIHVGLGNFSFIRGPTPLSLALLNQDNELVKTLLELGANPNTPYIEVIQAVWLNNDYCIDVETLTPLLIAITTQNETAIELLQIYGANPSFIMQKISGVKTVKRTRNGKAVVSYHLNLQDYAVDSL